MAEEYPEFGPIHGRMQSIYASGELVASGGFIFVHDAQREVENASCNKLLSGSFQELFRFCSQRNKGQIAELRGFFAPERASDFSWSAFRLRLLEKWLRVVGASDKLERRHGPTPEESL